MNSLSKTFLFFGVFAALNIILARLTYAQVLVNEFSSNTKSDWIELYSNEDVDLSGWTIDDEANAHVKVLLQGTTIIPSSNKYLVIEVGDRLNKGSDTITLRNKEGAVINSISYGKTGEVCTPSDSGSVARIPDGGNTFDRLAINTKGVTNGNTPTDPCPTPTTIPTSTLTNTPIPTNTPLPTNTISATRKPTPTLSPTDEPTETPEEVLGASEKSDGDNPTPDAKEQNLVQSSKKRNLLPSLVILSGVLLMAVPVFSFVKSKKVSKNIL